MADSGAISAVTEFPITIRPPYTACSPDSSTPSLKDTPPMTLDPPHDKLAEGKKRHGVDALRRGYRLGFVGGGDIHVRCPADDLRRESDAPERHPPKDAQTHPGGYTAAAVPSLTRKGNLAWSSLLGSLQERADREPPADCATPILRGSRPAPTPDLQNIRMKAPLKRASFDRNRAWRRVCACGTLSPGAPAARAASPLEHTMPLHADLPFARTEEATLCLDLYLPDGVRNPPILVSIHGGAWRTGSRKNPRSAWLVERGYALASIDYRLSSQARFPAQIHDCKGAVRWLRANAERFGYDASRLAAIGFSAGGHLAVLLGVATSVRELEGDVGGNLEHSSRVCAVVDYYGPTDFILRRQTQPDKTEDPGSRVYELLGGPVAGNEARARLASGAWQVGDDAAPLLAIHGTEDATVLMDQSHRIVAACHARGREAALHIVPGAGHGGPLYAEPEHRRPVEEFLDRHLRGPAAR